MRSTIRQATSTDYDRIIGNLDAWWGGRQMAAMLPRLFFTHFTETCFVAEANGSLEGFLAGFVSSSHPEQGYVHFIGVAPEARGQGIGDALYERFFEEAKGRGCTEALAVTSPVNTGSIAFHHRMGFEALPGDALQEGVPFTRDYDGPGEDRVRFRRLLDPVP
jgi:ribosomal protein S18 acetylase RimI-like enzyme